MNNNSIDSIKLFEITVKKTYKGKKVPYMRYAIVHNEEQARNMYCEHGDLHELQELKDDNYLDFKIVEEIEPTYENKLSVLLYDFHHKHFNSSRELSKHLNSDDKLNETWSKLQKFVPPSTKGDISLDKIFNFDSNKESVNEHYAKKIDKIQVDIDKLNKEIDGFHKENRLIDNLKSKIRNRKIKQLESNE